jgi:hypothetical protein
MPTKSTALVPFSAATLKSQAAQVSVLMNIDVPALQAEVDSYTEGLATMQVQANNFRITDDQSYTEAMELMRTAQKREAGLSAIWKRLKDVVNPVRNIILEAEHATVDPFTSIKQTLQRKGEKHLNDLAVAKRQAEAAFARVAEESRRRLDQEAENLMARGRFAEAQAKAQESAITVTPTLQNVIPTVLDARVGTKFKGSCTDILAFAKAIIEGKVDLMQEVKPGDSRPILLVDQVVLNAVVERHLDGLNWPGITVTSGAKISSR